MASFDMDVMEQVVAACQASQAEAAQALSRAFDSSVQLQVGESGPCRGDPLPNDYEGPGLILVMRVGTEAALFVVPAASGIVPEWAVLPDVTGGGKLATLSVELGMLLLPEAFPATDGSAAYVPDLAAALRCAGMTENAGRVAMQIYCGEKSGMASLIWPVSRPDAVLATSMPQSASDQNASELAEPAIRPEEPFAPSIRYEDFEEGISQLPPYTRSLLKIRVPVTVTLAEAKQPIQKVLEIGPGSIIHFSKPCEDSLTLEVAGQKVAVGEAVKVGEKFGLWITSIILPQERFWVVGDRRRSERAK